MIVTSPLEHQESPEILNREGKVGKGRMKPHRQGGAKRNYQVYTQLRFLLYRDILVTASRAEVEEEFFDQVIGEL